MDTPNIITPTEVAPISPVGSTMSGEIITKKRGMPKGGWPRKEINPSVSNQVVTPIDKANEEAKAVDALLAKVEQLERRDVENQAKLKMLYDVADKGRVFNYENSKVTKQAMKVKLSVFRDGIIVGWRTVKDELIKHPTTGLTVGENQQYEVLVLDKVGGISKAILNGYPAFSEARYAERVDVTVVSKKEDFQGNMTYDVMLPDGRTISLADRFLN